MDTLRLVWDFCLHILCGTLLFCVVGFAAVCLHWFLGWVEPQGLWPPIIYGLESVEVLIFFGDILAFIWYFVRVLWQFLQEIHSKTQFQLADGEVRDG